jgi:hypothetical protein
MALEKELEAYKKKLPELLAEAGKYALFHGDAFIGVFTSYEDAVKAGYEKFKLNDPFLVRQIQAVDQVQFVSRLFDPPAQYQSA